jgi:hypothetical protein
MASMTEVLYSIRPHAKLIHRLGISSKVHFDCIVYTRLQVSEMYCGTDSHMPYATYNGTHAKINRVTTVFDYLFNLQF